MAGLGRGDRGRSLCLQPQAAAVGKRTQIPPSAAHPQKATLQTQPAFLQMLFLSEQVTGIQLCIRVGQRQKADCRLREFSEIINKRGRNAQSGRIPGWPMKSHCLFQVLSFGWTLRGSVLLRGVSIKAYQ